MDRSKIVVIESFPSPGEAAIYKSLLEQNGIECELLNETISSMIPVGSVWGGVKLVVNEADEARARKLLAAGFDQEEFAKESSKRRKKP